MGWAEELLTYENEAKAGALAKVPESFTRFPGCSFCLGREPLSQFENNSTDEVTEYWINWEYVTGQNVHQLRYAHRLTHKKYGFTIEIHECADLGDWVLRLVGPWPKTQSAIRRVDAFIRYAWRTKKRGPKPKLQLSDILDALRRLPDTARWKRVEAETGVLTRTMQKILSDAGIKSLKEAKVIAKNAQR